MVCYFGYLDTLMMVNEPRKKRHTFCYIPLYWLDNRLYYSYTDTGVFYLHWPKTIQLLVNIPYPHMLHGTGIFTSRHFHLFMARHVSPFM